MKKSYRNIRFAFASAFAGLILTGLTSCGKEDANSPGFEFMPDMYRSPSLEYYNTNVIDGDTINTAMMPVAGSVARGFIPYAYPNSDEGLKMAHANLKNPLPFNEREQWEAEGEVLFSKFCIHCHGATGAGDGKVGAKLPGPPPPYQGNKDLTEGRIFHVITYGKGLMGAHQSLLNQEERWKLVYFVQKLMAPQDGGTAKDSTATASAAIAAPTAKATAADKK